MHLLVANLISKHKVLQLFPWLESHGCNYILKFFWLQAKKEKWPCCVLPARLVYPNLCVRSIAEVDQWLFYGAG